MKRGWTMRTGAYKSGIPFIISSSHYFLKTYIFYVFGEVYKPSIRIWGVEKPHDTCDVFRNSRRVAVLEGFIRQWGHRCCETMDYLHCITGAYYFDNPIVDRESYLSHLSWCFLPKLPTPLENTIFQCAGVPTFYSSQARQPLDILLPGSWIRRSGPSPGHLTNRTSCLCTSPRGICKRQGFSIPLW